MVPISIGSPLKKKRLKSVRLMSKVKVFALKDDWLDNQKGLITWIHILLVCIKNCVPALQTHDKIKNYNQ